MPITVQQLGARLRAAREASQLTQDEVAKHLEVSRPTYVQIEAGNRAVSALDLDKLALFFGRDIREFLGDSFRETDGLAARLLPFRPGGPQRRVFRKRPLQHGASTTLVGA